MKKIIVLLFSCFLFLMSARAQTPAEWMQQKKTQEKYLLQQRAALKLYGQYAKKGYDVATKALATISNIKNKDFSLHQKQVSSLKNVNPKIGSYSRIADVVAFQGYIRKQAKGTIDAMAETRSFSPAELTYCKKVFENLLEECIQTINELVMVITPTGLQLTDDERATKMDRLCLDMQAKYAFCSSFSQEVGLLSVQRSGEQPDKARLKTLIGIK